MLLYFSQIVNSLYFKSNKPNKRELFHELLMKNFKVEEELVPSTVDDATN